MLFRPRINLSFKEYEMSIHKSASLLVAGAAMLTMAACTSVQPVPYSGVASSSQLKQNRNDDSAKVPYRYDTPVTWSQYSKVVLDPVTVYRGSDNHFGDMKDADKMELADYMSKTFSEKLSKRFNVTRQAGPNTLRINLTLTGAEKTKPVVGQFMHFDIAGNLYNGVQAVRGGQGAFSGSVSYAVEIHDGSTGRLLEAYVSKQYPNAMNLPAAFGSLSAAKTGLDKGADALVERLR